MLIVVAIIATLMTIVFRLGSAGGEDSCRTATVVKLQKIENCLSGYYAAFGSYPPVKVHGSRDIYTAVEKGTGDQKQESNTSFDWGQVNAACRSQPFGCEYPGSEEDKTTIESWVEEISERYNNKADYPEYAKSEELKELFGSGGSVSGQPDVSSGGGGSGWGANWDNADWKVVKLFKFGAMSYLLPRYLFMMGDKDIFTNDDGIPAQWSDNNDTPCNPYQGEPFSGWNAVWKLSNTENKSDSQSRNDLAILANIPSQAVCARWMPNLENTCRTLRTMKFFGVTISQSNQTGLGLDDEYPPTVNPHKTPAGDKPYLNASITMLDGWWREFYYYSPAPYQSYVVWSAGRNGCTFPPWMDRTKLSDEKVAGAKDPDDGHIMTVSECVEDDIMQMSH